MKAVIMAGGKGTRLRPLTSRIPKPLVPLLNKPCMEYTIHLLKRFGITDIAVTLQYLPEHIINYFGDGSDWGVNLHYFEEKVPLGTAGSVKNAQEFLDETFIVMSGDTLTNLNIEEAVQFHHSKQAEATLVLKQVKQPLEFGLVLTNENNEITRFIEKPSWGETFSDKVNTGLYILEPSIFDYMDKDTEVDFSKDVFPKLLNKEGRLYGFEAVAYWSDIGNIETYRQTQMDMLKLEIFPDLMGRQVSPGIFVEEDVQIDHTVQMMAPCYIGSHSKIQPRSTIGPFTIIGKNNVIKTGSEIKKSILWDHVIVEPETSMTETVVCNQTHIGSGSVLMDHSVVGSGCNLGKKTYIKEKVKIWPNKVIDSFSRLHTSVVSGHQGYKHIFDQGRVKGTANVHMTPDFLAKLASAYASELKPGSKIVVSSCAHPFASLMLRAMVTGLQSSGVEVIELGQTIPAVNRFSISTLQATGGVHVEMSNPLYHSDCDIIFYDEKGLPISKNLHRKIENALIQENFSRIQPDEIKESRFVPQVAENYLHNLLSQINPEFIRQHRFRIVVSADKRNLSSLLHQWATFLQVELVYIEDTLPDEYLKDMVLSENADLGLWIDNNAHEIILISNQGEVVQRDQLWGLYLYSLLAQHPEPYPIAVPVNSSSLLDSIAKELNTELIKTANSQRAIMELHPNWRFHPVYDPILGVSLLLQWLASENKELSDILQSFPQAHVETRTLPCPQEWKGTVMREMIEREEGQPIEYKDGIKVYKEDGFVWIKPDEVEPLIHLLSEAKSKSQALKTAQEFSDKIYDIQGNGVDDSCPDRS